MSHAQAADPLDGTPYRSLSLVGAGGMGSVIEAERRDIRRRVAVKVLHAQGGATELEEDRLRVEAEALASIQSRHVVPILDFGRTARGALFFAMELMRGRSLQEELKVRGTLRPLEALAIARQVLAGLEAAHRKGIVHRDLKPANIFLCDAESEDPGDVLGGRLVRVLDFGIAKILGNASGPTPPMIPTAEGVVIGTPRYLSPEHVIGGIEPRSDVYQVGLVLYVMLAGRGPFQEAGLAGFARSALMDTPEPPSRYAPQPIAAELDAVILRCLEKNPADRFRSARSLSDALSAITPHVARGVGPIPAPAVPRKRALQTVLMPIVARAAAPAPPPPAQHGTELLEPRAPVRDAASEPRAWPSAPAALPPRPGRHRVFWILLVALLAVVNAILIYALRKQGWAGI